MTIDPKIIEKAVDAIAPGSCNCREGHNQHGYWRQVDMTCPHCGNSEAKARAVLEAVADDLRADDREQWARGFAQELATTSIQSAQYIGQMVTSTLDALLAMTRASVIAEAKAKALREAAEVMRSSKDIGHWNLRDPRDPEISCGPDVWLGKLADAIEAGQP